MNSLSKTTARQDVLTVTPEFKKEAARSIIAIVGFIVVYLLLFALSIGIVLLSIYGGIALVAMHPSFYTLLIGIGLVASFLNSGVTVNTSCRAVVFDTLFMIGGS